jgi:hypothetical protein
MKALEGARRTLAAGHPAIVMCELNDEMARMAGSSAAELVGRMESWGFRMFLPRAFPFPLMPLREVPAGIFENVFFIRS